MASPPSRMVLIKRIKQAIKDSDIEQLRQLGKKHGFVNDKLRKVAWPIVLNLKRSKQSRNRSSSNKKRSSLSALAQLSIIIDDKHSSAALPAQTTEHAKQSLSLISIDSTHSTHSNPSLHTAPPAAHSTAAASATTRKRNSNHDQIEKDIARSSLNFYASLIKFKEEQSQSQDNLGRILHAMFDDSLDMHYIQGFNDVVSVFYIVCDQPKLTHAISKRVARTLLREYLIKTHKHASSELNFERSLNCILQLIGHYDTQLHARFASIDSVCSLSFCVSWLLTWFAHEVRDLLVIARIYDYCLCSDQYSPLYLSAALLLHCKADILRAVHDDITRHIFFQSLDWQSLDFNAIIETAEALYTQYPPHTVIATEPTGNEEDEDEQKSADIRTANASASGSSGSDNDTADAADRASDCSSVDYNTDFTPNVTPFATPFATPRSTPVGTVDGVDNAISLDIDIAIVEEEEVNFGGVHELQLPQQSMSVSMPEPASNHNIRESTASTDSEEEKHSNGGRQWSFRGRRRQSDLMEKIEKIPDVLTHSIDGFIALFDKKHKHRNDHKKSNSVHVATTTHPVAAAPVPAPITIST